MLNRSLPMHVYYDYQIIDLIGESMHRRDTSDWVGYRECQSA